MFGSQRNPLAAYSHGGLEAQVEAATPHQLILMLFEGAATALNVARLHMQANEYEQKGALISRAISIIASGLQASLDREAGGELAENLHALYGYMVQRLLEANRHNDVARLDEVSLLLLEIHSAWKQIGADPAAAVH